MKEKPAIFLIFVVLMPLLSCTAQIKGSLERSGQADLHISASLEPGITRFIRTLSAAAGTAHQGPILNGPAISKSMAAAPGIASVFLNNTTAEKIEGPVKISRIGDFLKHGEAAGFIGFEQEAAGRGRLTISINRNSAPDILTFISPDIIGYLEALMAPIVTGENLTNAEYLGLIFAFYGKNIADEISKATIRASIDFPAAVQSMRGGTSSGRRAEFAVPLVDILVLEAPLQYEVIW